MGSLRRRGENAGQEIVLRSETLSILYGRKGQLIAALWAMFLQKRRTAHAKKPGKKGSGPRGNGVEEKSSADRSFSKGY